MIKALITAVGGDIGQGVIKALRLAAEPLRIIGADISPESAGVFLADKGYLVTAAAVLPEKFIEEVITICQKENIDIVFSCHENEQYILAKNIGRLTKATKAYFVVQSADVLELCRDKVMTNEYLARAGIRVPETAASLAAARQLAKKLGYPLIIKPRRSSGSRNVMTVSSAAELEEYWGKIDNPLAQERVSNKNEDEFTVGVFLSDQGRAIQAIGIKRALRFGLTVFGVVDNYQAVKELAVLAAEAVRATGPCNVQLRLDRNNSPVVIEINPRLSSTVAFKAKLGFNEPLAVLDHFLFKRNPEFKVQSGKAIFKTWDELILPAPAYDKLKSTGEIDNDLAA